MPSGPVRRVSCQDIQVVQNLIERCLQLHMNQKEVVETLLDQAKVEPKFTELVWQKLEEENREFFKAYYLRLIVKHQIIEFNELLEWQVQLMHQMQAPEVTPVPATNGSHIQSFNQKQVSYAPEKSDPSLKPENMQHPMGSNLPNPFPNRGSSLNPNMPTTVDMSAHARRVDAPPTMLSAQVPNTALMQGMDGETFKPEFGYSGRVPYVYGSDGNVLEARPTVGDASAAPFNKIESNSQPLNDQLLDAYAFGFLSQIPRTFSLSDLTADLSQSQGILESCNGSPFLTTDTENFLDSRQRGEYQSKEQ